MLRYLEDCDLAGNKLAHVEYVSPHRACGSHAALAHLHHRRRSTAQFRIAVSHSRYSEAVYGLV